MKKSINTSPACGSILVGLDWAKHKHDICFLNEEAELEYGQVEQNQAGLDLWLEGLCERFAGRRIAICMEAGRDPLLWRLEGHDRVDLFLVNTTTASRYRKTFAPSGDKSDRRDAASLLDLLRSHPEKTRPHKPASAQDRAIDQLTRARRQAVGRKTALISSLREVLELYYPVVSKLFEALDSDLAIAFLRRWPDGQQLEEAPEREFVEFFHKHRCRSQKRIDERLKFIKQSSPLTGSHQELVTVGRLRIEEHLRELEVLKASIKDYEQALEEAFNSHQKKHLFDGLPGAAEALAPRLLAAFAVIDPKDAEEMQTVCGIAPIRVQSGLRMLTFMRERCPKFLRQSFHEFAGSSVRYSAWAKAFYADKTKNKKWGSSAAKRALAYKWIRVLTACWISDTPYSEIKYIAQLQRRKSPLADLILENNT